MDEVKIESYAKINLVLNILSRREDGYHDIESIMQTISLSDKVTLKEKLKGINIICDHAQVPVNEGGLAYRTAEKILSECKIGKGIQIKINKKIPLASGLAGGSSNSAAILKGINSIYHLGLTDDKLKKIGEELGMDIPFFIRGGTALAYDRGEKVHHYNVKSPLWLIVINPGFEVSTLWAYRNLDIQKDRLPREYIDRMTTALKSGNPGEISRNLHNSFERTVIKKFPEVGYIKERLIKEGVMGASMSGSGPTVFGIAKNKDSALKIYNRMRCEYRLIWLVHTV